MSEDTKISELISKSLHKALDPSESKLLEAHLEQNEEARKFAELSRLIQQSVDHKNQQLSSDDEESPGLSKDAQARLKESVSEAIKEKLSLSHAGIIETTLSATSNSAINQRTILRAQPYDQNQDQQRQLISRFRLIRRLGQGGLGNVWLARDERLNRTVAIKELRPEALESEKAWQRFHREAEITGHLEHPNVVPLYQFGVDQATAEPFYAMRFVGKRTLADAILEHHDRIEAGEADALSLHRLLTVFLDVCQAIAYAHSRGVIHRDIKPENVALDNFGQVIVLDWGLAKVQEDSELATKMTSATSINESTLAQTMDGDVIGTPLYMSPEQAAGQLDRIDDRTDVYGLGAILFSILTGHAPHERAAKSDSLNLESILKYIAESETPRTVDYCENVPSDLDAICRKAMAVKQHLRYETVQELAGVVERWIAGQSEKQSAYENLRMEGRELRADLKSSVRNLERNVRFGAGLPPIEQLIWAESDEDISIWRERLSSIFQGLLRANPDYHNIVYGKLTEGEFSEIVRVERHSSEHGSIRTVPRSRLRTDSANDYLSRLSSMKPGEVLTSLVCDPLCERSEGCESELGLLSGVPVYDDKTEEVFGYVMINCDIDSILRRQMSRRMNAAEIIVACDVFHTMMHTRSGQISEGTLTRPVAEVAPHFSEATKHLQKNLDYIDTTNSDIYGARLWFIPNQHGIMYLLKRKDA